MPPKFYPKVINNLKEAGIERKPLTKTSPYRSPAKHNNVVRRTGEEGLSIAEVRAIRLKEEEQKRWMMQQSKMKTTREIYTGATVFVDPTMKRKKEKKKATPVLQRKKVIEVPEYSSDPKIRQAQYDLIQLRKDMREKRMNFVDEERVLYREVYKLRETSRKAMSLITQGAKHKATGDLLISKLTGTLDGLRKTLKLLEGGIYPVPKQTGEVAPQSEEDRKKTETLNTLIEGMSNISIVSLEEEKKQKSDRENLIAQEWEIMDEKSVNFETIAEYDEAAHEVKKYVVFISERHHKNMKTLHKDIDEYLDINKKASGIVQIIAAQKKERSTKRKTLRGEIEALEKQIAAKEAELGGGDGGDEPAKKSEDAAETTDKPAENGDAAADAAAETKEA